MSLLLAAGGVSRSLICAAGAYTYSGKNSTLGVGLTANSGAYSYSGIASTLNVGLIASTGNYSYVGIAGTLGVGLTASTGAYSYSGIPASLGIALTATSGVYSYTGVAATLLKIGTTNNSGGGSNKKKRKKLPYRLQAQYVFGDSFSSLEDDIQEQLDELPTNETSAEIALYLKATQFKQTLSLAEAQYRVDELKRAYDAAIASVEYLKLIKRIKDDEEAMTLIISALYG